MPSTDCLSESTNIMIGRNLFVDWWKARKRRVAWLSTSYFTFGYGVGREGTGRGWCFSDTPFGLLSAGDMSSVGGMEVMMKDRINPLIPVSASKLKFLSQPKRATMYAICCTV